MAKKQQTFEIIGDTRVETIINEIDLDPLRDELKDIKEEIKRLKKEPDEIMVPNNFKFDELLRLDIRKSEILLLLDN